MVLKVMLDGSSKNRLSSTEAGWRLTEWAVRAFTTIAERGRKCAPPVQLPGENARAQWRRSLAGCCCLLIGAARGSTGAALVQWRGGLQATSRSVGLSSLFLWPPSFPLSSFLFLLVGIINRQRGKLHLIAPNWRLFSTCFDNQVNRPLATALPAHQWLPPTLTRSILLRKRFQQQNKKKLSRN